MSGDSPKVGSTSMALSASLRASGRAMSLVNAAARFEYPFGSLGFRLIASP